MITDKRMRPEMLREVFYYNAETGELRWKAGERDKTREGRLITTKHGRGYIKAKFMGVRYFAHHVAWAMVYGEWPSAQIDHVNGDRGDNRISNLRQVSNAENQRNRGTPRTNKSGKVGVYWHVRQRRWVAVIGDNREKIYLGGYVNFEDARAAREEAEARYGYHQNHGRASWNSTTECPA